MTTSPKSEISLQAWERPRVVRIDASSAEVAPGSAAEIPSGVGNMRPVS